MNDIIYFGRGVPSQVTVHPTSVFYDPANAARYASYDPEYANSLLDELGLDDPDGDGLRNYPDGSQLVITMEFLDFETPKAITMELVADYWRAVGVDLRLKLVDRSLQSARAQAGEMQMTLWHADKVMDVLFPLLPDWFVPHRAGWDIAMWNDWARYYQTGGRIGEEPPPVIKQIPPLERPVPRSHRPDRADDRRTQDRQRGFRKLVDYRHGWASTASDGDLAPSEERADHRHLGLGQSLDAGVPPVDLVFRRGLARSSYSCPTPHRRFLSNGSHAAVQLPLSRKRL